MPRGFLATGALSNRSHLWGRDQATSLALPREGALSCSYLKQPPTEHRIPNDLLSFRRIGSTTTAMADLEAARINHDNHLLLVRRRHRLLIAAASPIPSSAQLLTPTFSPGPIVPPTPLRAPPQELSLRPLPPRVGLNLGQKTCSERPPTAPSTARTRPKMSSRTWTKCWSRCAG